MKPESVGLSSIPFENLVQLAATDPQSYAKLIFKETDSESDLLDEAAEGFSTGSGSRSINLFLKLNGQPIDGEPKETSLGRAKSIECISYEQGVTIPRDVGSGQATGRRSYAPLVIRKRIDRSSPLLLKGLTENQVVEGTFKFYRPSSDSDGTVEQFYTVVVKQGRIGTLKQIIAGVRAESSSPGSEIEEVSFTFRQISWTYVSGGITHEDTRSFTESVAEAISVRIDPQYNRWIQQSLNQILGLNLTVDGVLSSLSRGAIRRFQQERGLVVDGEVGPMTERALVNAGAPQPPALSGITPSTIAATGPCPGQTHEVVSGFTRYSNEISTLPPPEQAKVRALAGLITRSFKSGCQPITQIELIGHADHDPVREASEPGFEVEMSQRRADSMKRALSDLIANPGIISAIRFESRGVGSIDLVVPNSTNELERARNRRVELNLVPSPIPPSPALDPRIDICAQFALLRMNSSDAAAQADSAGILAAVKGGQLAGILSNMTRAAVPLAQRLNVTPFDLVPRGEDAALVLDPAEPLTAPPSIVFRNIQMQPGEQTQCPPPEQIDPALRKAWATFVLLKSGQLGRCELPRRNGPVAFGASTEAETLVAPLANILPPILCRLSEPPPTKSCQVFLSGNSSGDYFRYVQAQTTGIVTPLINGRSSGGVGPDIDFTEPLDEMQAAVSRLGTGDFVYLSAWFFEPATQLTAGSFGSANTWGTFLAAKANAGVKVRIILNDFDPISGLDKWLQSTSLRPLDAIIKALPKANRGNFKYIVSMHPAHVGPLKSLLAGQGGRNINIASHHQKFMVVRHGEEMHAFCGGLDIESRKTPARWSYSGLIGWHDLHVKLEGPITRDIEKEFVLRWNREKARSTRPLIDGWAGHETLQVTPLSTVDNAPRKRPHRVQMLRTISSDALLAPFSNERDDIIQVYRRSIRCARDFIYMENQYYRSPSLADDIVRQGQRQPSLKIIIVVVAAAAEDDGTNAITEHGDHLQFETFQRIFKGFGAQRVRLYTMNNRAVHSKFFLADDEIMIVGSANANERSFQLDSELNIVVTEPSLVSSFRRKLWAHNLGEPAVNIAGWRTADFIGHWDSVAAANAALSAPQMAGEGVIPFDFTAVKGRSHGSLPDELANIDFSPESGVFAGPIPPERNTIALRSGRRQRPPVVV